MSHKQQIEKGEALFGDGQIDQAEAIFKSILKDNPEDEEVLNNLGVIHHFRRNFKEAEDYLLKTLSVKEDYPDALCNLANLYQDTQRWEEAALQLKKYIAINDKDPNFFTQLGVVYLKMGDVERARAVLAKSLQLNPDQEPVRDLLQELERMPEGK
jgi:Flp pilus assembly protein TadD